MKKFYVVGEKVSKSLSPIIFNYWFKKYKINAKYSYLELTNKNFDKIIRPALRDKNLVGLNITIPFKKKIMKYIDILDKHSKKINAVNCLIIKPNKIKGINTDWLGYFNTLPKIKNLKKKKVVLIGYGGAALAIHYVLKLKGLSNISIINRTRKRLNYEKKTKYTISNKKLNKFLVDADIVINTTPINPINLKNIKLINKKTLLSDIVYRPKETNFLKTFPNNKKIYGINMLLEQAALCFEAWFGYKPHIDAKLIKALDQKIK